MNTFFTADTHFHHGNLAQHRGFSSVEEMDELIIQRWNKTVSKKDKVWHLGDFSWYPSRVKTTALRARLNGEIHLIRGNHDPKKDWFKALFATFQSLTVVKHQGGIPLVLCHYALRVWPSKHYGTAHLFGHSHGTLKVHSNECAMDVGVDCHDFTPVSLDFIFEYMKPRSELVLANRKPKTPHEQENSHPDQEVRRRSWPSPAPVEESVCEHTTSDPSRAEGSHAQCDRCSFWEPRVNGGSGMPRVGNCNALDKLTYYYHGAKCSGFHKRQV